jgi:hypothetical protein
LRILGLIIAKAAEQRLERAREADNKRRVEEQRAEERRMLREKLEKSMAVAKVQNAVPIAS